MGKVKYLTKIKELLRENPVFSSKDVELIVGNKAYAHLLLHNLTKRGEIHRIKKGCYSWSADPILSVFCFKPAYLGLQEALSLYNLWEQETNVVIVTSKIVREGVRHIFDSNVIVYRLNPRYLFGIDYIKYDNYFLPVSDIEKTIIDFIYFNNMPPKNVVRKIRNRISQAKLNAYLKKYPLRFQRKVKERLFSI